MTLEQRLENWARVQRGGSGGASPLTASIYGRSVRGTSIDSSLDVQDAEKIQRALVKLMPLDRTMLQMHYVWRAAPPFICRRLRLKVRPNSIFDLALLHAHRAIEEALAEPKPTYVSMQSVVDRLQADVVA